MRPHRREWCTHPSLPLVRYSSFFFNIQSFALTSFLPFFPFHLSSTFSFLRLRSFLTPSLCLAVSSTPVGIFSPSIPLGTSCCPTIKHKYIFLAFFEFG